MYFIIGFVMRVPMSIVVLGLVSLLAALYVAASPPEFSKDSQYYLQAGYTWANGEITYGASLIGARVLVVLTWYLPQLALGVSVDTITITLGLIFLLYCAGVMLWVYQTVPPAGRFWLSLVLILVGLIWLPWSRPLTEALLVVVAILVLVMYDLARRTASPRARLLWLLALGSLCGAAMGIRPGFLLLFAAVIGCLVLGAVAKQGARHLAGPVLGACLAFTVAAQIPGLAFGALSGRDMPPQFSGYSLFWKTTVTFGDPAFGPHSQRLYELGEAMLARGGKLQTDQIMRLGFSEAYRTEGAQAADDLFAGAGWETLRNRPEDSLLDVSAALGSYLLSGIGEWRIDRRSYDARLAAARSALEKIDRLRVEAAQVRFGGDATYPVANILEHRLEVAPLFERVGGLPKLYARPPAWTISLLGLVVLALALRRGDYDDPIVVVSLFFIVLVCLASFSQGYVPRYWAPGALLVLIASTISLAQSRVNVRAWAASLFPAVKARLMI